MFDLDQNYFKWLHDEIAAGRATRPKFPRKEYFNPPILEAERRTLGKTVEELEAEFASIKSIRASGAFLSPAQGQRLVDVTRELDRLKAEKLDIAWSAHQENAYNRFLGRIEEPTVAATTKVETGTVSKLQNIRSGVLKNRKLLIAGAAGLIGAYLLFSGRDDTYNTIEGMHPGSNGIGAQQIRAMTPFGSGLILAELFNSAKSTVIKDAYEEYQEDSPELIAIKARITRMLGIRGVKFAGMPNSGTFAARTRGELTEFKEDFASRWDPAVKLAEKIPAFSKTGVRGLLEDAGFVTALRSGKRIKQLGETGGWGAAFLHEATYGGESFKYVVKEAPESVKGIAGAVARSEESFKKEFEALRDIGGDIMPTAYGLHDNKLFMEYMPGKTIRQLQSEGGYVPLATINREVGQQIESVASRGYKNIDINPGNILVDPSTGRVSWIDFGVAERSSASTAAESMKANLQFFNDFWFSEAKAIQPGEKLFGGVNLTQKKPANEWSLDSLVQSNKMEGVHPGTANSLGAMSIKKHSEFGSGWDPLRRIAKEVFGGAEELAFKKMTSSQEFRSAIAAGLKTGGRKIGEGRQAETWAYKTAMSLGGKTHEFEFVAKRAMVDTAGLSASAAVRRHEMAALTMKTEAGALQALGAERAPSFYGHGKEFGLAEESVIMEKFNLGKSLEDAKLTGEEASSIESFIKGAHKKGITHTDLHGENIVRAITAEGKSEPAVLDWGLANRFMENAGIGGHQEAMLTTSAYTKLSRMIQEKAGRVVPVQEFSEIGDIMRVRAHRAGAKATGSSSAAINSIYLHKEASDELRTLNEELAHMKNIGAKPALVKDYEDAIAQAQKALGQREKLLTSVADDVSDYIANNPISHKGYVTPGQLGTAVQPKIRRNIQRVDDMATAQDTMEMYGPTALAPGSAVTADVRNADLKTAIKRNARFREMSQRSVGIGLRSSNMATKGHANFNSTKR